jgi:hypothetical protein
LADEESTTSMDEFFDESLFGLFEADEAATVTFLFPERGEDSAGFEAERPGM